MSDLGAAPSSPAGEDIPFTVVRLHHVGVVVQDRSSALEWYRTNLGFEHQYDFVLPGAQLSMLVRADARLELIEVEGSAAPPPERLQVETLLGTRGINHLALGVDDLDAAVTWLAARGVEIAIPPSDVPNTSGDRFAFIRDDEHNLIELFQASR